MSHSTHRMSSLHTVTWYGAGHAVLLRPRVLSFCGILAQDLLREDLGGTPISRDSGGVITPCLKHGPLPHLLINLLDRFLQRLILSTIPWERYLYHSERLATLNVALVSRAFSAPLTSVVP